MGKNPYLQTPWISGNERCIGPGACGVEWQENMDLGTKPAFCRDFIITRGQAWFTTALLII